MEKLDENKRAEPYEQRDAPVSLEADLAETMSALRAIWPTFFNLASMTFAWNASLAAGMGFLVYFEVSDQSPLAGHSAQALSRMIALVVGCIGIVYNFGAAFAFHLMNKIAQELVTDVASYSTLSPGLKIARVFQRVKPDLRKKRPLEILTYVFFGTLALSWTLSTGYTAYLIWIS